ncbi:MAG: type IV pilus secretin PilQ [Candidatus Omnitrophota bacterium]
MRLLILILLLLSCNFLFAQETEVPDPASVDTVEEVTEAAPGNVTLDFRDADIRNVLRLLSYKSGVNIIAAPDVTGLVTIQLTDVPWETALDVILKTYGYGYDQKENIISVTTLDQLAEKRRIEQELAAQEPLTTEIFILNFAKAEDVLDSVKEVLTPRGRINFDQRTNALMVIDSASNMKQVRKIVPVLDAVTPQVLIETKIIKTTLTDTENLGIDWTIQATVRGAQHPMIWPFKTDSAKSKFDPGFFPDPFPGTAITDDATSTGTFRYGTLDFVSLQAVLEILAQRTDTNILSNPRLVTLDNQTASIVVGQKYPQPEYTYNEDQATMQVSGWDYIDIGIILEVTPHVNKAGFVTLDIFPQVTAIDSYATVQNTTMPVLSTEETKTQVMIKDGETLVIAGLIKDQVTDIRKKVPLLGDIPLLGLLFQKKTMTKTKTDLLIFITPHIITPSIASEEPEV